MIVIKRAIIFYVIGVILLFAIEIILGEEMRLIVKNLGYWILPATFSALGLLIGAVAYVLLRQPSNKKKIIFLVAHLLSLTCLISLAIFVHYKDVDYQSHANIDSNHNVMNYFVNDNEGYIRIGFNRLESEFKNANDFDLNKFLVNKKDTIVNGVQDTIYNIYFTYFLKGNKFNKYFSKVSVFEGKPTLALYNLDTKSNEEYLTLTNENEKFERKTIESIKEDFQQMPESTRRAMIDTIKKAFSE